MITLKEIARLSGVSPSTVSNILNGRSNVGEETRKRVLQIIKEQGYHPNYFASNMRKANSKMIVIITEDLKQFTTSPIVVSLMAHCEEKGYRTILINLRMYDRWQDKWYRDEEKLRSVLDPALYEAEAIKADGIIYVAGHGRVINCIPKDLSIPIVMTYATSDNPSFPSILIDDEKGGYDMGRYLISMGHKKIAVITGVESNMHTQKRLKGFQRALSESGMALNPDWVFQGKWLRPSGYACAKAAYETGASVIWCMNDQMAAGVYDYLYEHQIQVGRDISVAGFDHMENAEYMYPKLTTNELPLSEIGSISAEKMIEVIEKGSASQEKITIEVPCTMVFGTSVIKLSE